MQEIRSFIAVIDDDKSMCQALSRLLHLAGYEVRSYFSAESFLNDPDHARACFLVADIQLRGMSGFDLQQRLGEEGHHLPVAFMTAHDEPPTQAEARDSACVGYFRKPFPSSELLEAIRSALAPSDSPSNPSEDAEAGNGQREPRNQMSTTHSNETKE